MVYAIALLSICILALLLSIGYRRLRSRGELPQYRDLDDLNEVVNGILKRERAKAGRERAQLSRDSTESGPVIPRGTAPPDIGALGGVVRPETPVPVEQLASFHPRARRKA